MLEHKTIKWILKILGFALVIYVIILLMNEDNHRVIQPKQEYVSASVDSSVQVIQIDMRAPAPADTFVVVDMPNVVAVVDSDSTTRYNLYREEQEIVTIDLEEHKEVVYFTWEDIKAYILWTYDYIIALLNKIK